MAGQKELPGLGSARVPVSPEGRLAAREAGLGGAEHPPPSDVLHVRHPFAVPQPHPGLDPGTWVLAPRRPLSVSLEDSSGSIVPNWPLELTPRLWKASGSFLPCVVGFHFCRGHKLAVVGIRKKLPSFHGEKAGGLRPEGKGWAQPCWPRLAKSCGSLGLITCRPNLAASEQLLSVSQWTVWLTRGPTGKELFPPGQQQPV